LYILPFEGYLWWWEKEICICSQLSSLQTRTFRVFATISCVGNRKCLSLSLSLPHCSHSGDNWLLVCWKCNPFLINFTITFTEFFCLAWILLLPDARPKVNFKAKTQGKFSGPFFRYCAWCYNSDTRSCVCFIESLDPSLRHLWSSSKKMSLARAKEPCRTDHPPNHDNYLQGWGCTLK
jgi:hypothetical protein